MSAGTAVLERAWRADLGAGSNDRVQIAAPPVIADGVLYFLDADHRVHAVNARDGERIWTQALRPHSGRDRAARGGGVAAAGGRVFVTTGFGFIVALDAGNGDGGMAHRWRRAVPIGAHRVWHARLRHHQRQRT